MQPKSLPFFKSTREALDAGIREANRRECGKFDGLLGGLDPEGEESILLREIVSHLRDYLLDRYSDAEAQSLLEEFEPRPGYRNMPAIDDDVQLAIDLLNMIRSAARCEPERFAKLVFGAAIARDKSRQAGTRKERRPEITKWIERQLAHDPDAKSPRLWACAPEWITDDIGFDRFRKRVTAIRKKCAASN